METNEHADEWFKLMEEKGYSKHTVFIAGYEKAMEDIIKFTDWVNENAYKYPTNTTTRELLEIYKKNNTWKQ